MTVSDDGVGISRADREETEEALLERLTQPGYTTKREAEDTSGRGVGLDVVKYNTEKLLGGTLSLEQRRRGLRLRFVYRRRGPSLLVADGRLNNRGLGVASRSKTGRGRATVPIFLLVPQVKLPKRLDLDRDAERAQEAVPGLIVANWVEGRFS